MAVPVRVLAFSPYLSWRIHANYETTFTRACQSRGAEVKHILCDGLFAECDMYGVASVAHGRPHNLCETCQLGATAALNGTGLTHEWLGGYITEAEKHTIFQWAQ